ncbi:hypothetical protein [Rathayibacter sp. VKM Ac-2878]|uniref:hypothetical protein n=1 Tax=Rathayibacter sp. VKM Ac-2878 TaxID=2783831 RepID=UPI00188C468A|nr:hypothetical protein [Rathayibacter sp. VKM Ac-2878]MBF4503690.1 hypothetical protein [Rathayibacter sp. VKM Ac-2878]
MAMRLFGDSTQLPDETLEKIGIQEDEVRFLYGLNRSVRQYVTHKTGINGILVQFVEEARMPPGPVISEAVNDAIEIEIPITLAQKIYALLYSTVIYQRWPELRYTIGANPEEISNVFLDLFGKGEPTFSSL